MIEKILHDTGIGFIFVIYAIVQSIVFLMAAVFLFQGVSFFQALRTYRAKFINYFVLGVIVKVVLVIVAVTLYFLGHTISFRCL